MKHETWGIKIMKQSVMGSLIAYMKTLDALNKGYVTCLSVLSILFFYKHMLGFRGMRSRLKGTGAKKKEWQMP